MLISLFVACYNDTLYPQTGKAVVTVLERLGHQLEFRSAQTCCGQMHYNTGYWNEALPLMRSFLDTFRDAEVICIPSASCVAMIRDQYPRIAAETGDAALRTQVAEVLPRIHEFTELLVDTLGVTDVGATFPYSVTLHTSCHSLRSLRLQDQPTRLLEAVQGLRLIELPDRDECCGFGGTFSLKNAEVSVAMLADKVACVRDTQAQVCTATDNSCLMQIGGALRRNGSGVRCPHIAEILASTSTAADEDR